MVFLMHIIKELSNKMIQIEIIKKAENIAEAEKIGKKNITAEQELDEKLIKEEEKLLLKVEKLSPEEIKTREEESQWKPF